MQPPPIHLTPALSRDDAAGQRAIALRYRTRSNWTVGLSLLLSAIGTWLMLSSSPQTEPLPGLFGSLLTLGAVPLMLYGCCSYARSKGYHWALGLISFFGLPGLLVLMLLPNQFAAAFAVDGTPPRPVSRLIVMCLIAVLVGLAILFNLMAAITG
jgi:FtsH-binding integral membrane protein